MSHRCLVTGATGLVGYNIAAELRDRGFSVRALVRDIPRAKGLAPSDIELVVGDVTDSESVSAAMAGCTRVYHAAGLPEQWRKNTGDFDRVNLGGTQTLGEEALRQGVDRFVYTSTIDVFRGAAGQSFDEDQIDPDPKGTAYERSKQKADQWVAAAMERGLPAVFIHPAGVYGPGPAGSPGTNQFIDELCRRKVPALLPGGMPLVYSRDLGRAHVLATDREVGSRYIVSEGYYTLRDIAQRVAEIWPGARVPRTMPLWLAKLVSVVGEWISKVIRRPPLLPKGQLHFLLWGAIPNARRAVAELGLDLTPLTEGISRTAEYLGHHA